MTKQTPEKATTSGETVEDSDVTVVQSKPEKVATVKLRVRGGSSNWSISTNDGVYHAVDGVIELPADIASRIE